MTLAANGDAAITHETEAQTGTAPLANDLASARVLLVEDNEFVRMSVALTLRKIGFGEIIEARDGEDALAKLEQASPQLIISDISMAPMNGLDFVERLRRHAWAGAKRVPVAFLTAHTESRFLRKAAELGVSTYFVKPVKREQFEAQLRILLESARSHETPRADEARRAAKFRIVEATSESDMAAALALRYRVFIDEMGYIPGDGDPDRGLGEHGDDSAHILMAYDGTTPAGTVTVDSLAKIDIPLVLSRGFHLDEFAEAFGRESLFRFRMAAVAQRYRSSLLFIMLVKRVAEYVARHEHARFAFVHAAPYLVSFYERLGYRRYAPHFEAPTRCGISVPLCFVIDDHEHLARVRSPLLEIVRAAGRVDRPEIRQYFETHWLGLDRALAAEKLVDGAPDMKLEPDRVGKSVQVPLFDQVDPARVKSLLSGRGVVRYKAQEALSIDDRSDDLLIVLRGYAITRREISGHKMTIETYGPGDAIGDFGLLAEAIQPGIPTAMTEVDAIRVPKRAIDDMATDSGVAAQINLNLARIVAQRLRATNKVITTMSQA